MNIAIMMTLVGVLVLEVVGLKNRLEKEYENEIKKENERVITKEED